MGRGQETILSSNSSAQKAELVRCSYVQLYGEPLNYPINVAAWTLGIGRSTFWEMIRKGLIRTVKIGRRRLVPREEVHRVRLGIDAGTSKSG